MERPPLRPSGLRHLRLKVGALLVLVPLAIIALTAYALHARGVFEPSRRITLVAQDVDGVSIGMPVTFSGFPIGSVRDMGLSDKGEVWIDITLRERDARWLRASSKFSLVRPIVGGARIRVETPNMADAQLADGARARLLVEDAMGALPDIVARVNDILANLDRMTGPESSINRSLAQLEVVTNRMAGERGVLEGLTGSAESSERIIATIDRLATLARTLDSAAQRVDRLLANADRKLLGEQGVADEARKAMTQLDAGLGELRTSIGKLDAVLENARGASADLKDVTGAAKDATADLAALRAQVDESIQRTNQLLREADRKWPFKRDATLRLP